MNKSLELGVVLSITTGVLLTRDFSAVHEALDYLTGDTLFTHQLPRAARAARPWLLKNLPQLAGSTPPENVDDILDSWLSQQKQVLGDKFDIEPMPAETWTHLCPVEEARQMRGDRA